MVCWVWYEHNKFFRRYGLQDFSTFILLDWHAWRRRAELELDATDLVNLRFGMRAHMLSAGLGVLSIAMTYSPAGPMFAGFIYVLMGPLHAWNGYRQGAAVRALEGGAPRRINA